MNRPPLTAIVSAGQRIVKERREPPLRPCSRRGGSCPVTESALLGVASTAAFLRRIAALAAVAAGAGLDGFADEAAAFLRWIAAVAIRAAIRCLHAGVG